MNAIDFRDTIIIPTLTQIELYRESAVVLLLGTAIKESGNFKYRRQLGGGPALSFYQIEPFTHDDCWTNFLHYKSDLSHKIRSLLPTEIQQDQIPPNSQLEFNDPYATAIARVKYLRVPEKLPEADNVDDMAMYWKHHYNTVKGNGRWEEWAEMYRANVPT